MGYNGADYPTASRLLEESIALSEANGDTRSAAYASARLASVDVRAGDWDTAIARAEQAFATLEAFEPGEELAVVAATLAGGYVFVGEKQKALEKAELAIGLAEALGSPEVLTRAFAAKALFTGSMRRPHETIALRRHQLTLAREHDLPELEANALFNLSNESFGQDRYEEALGYLSDTLAIARRRGSRNGEWATLAETSYPLFMLGRWDEALATFAEVPEDRLLDALTTSFLSSVPEIRIHRGDVAGARSLVAVYAAHADSPDLQDKTGYEAAAAAVARAEGRLEDALALGSSATEVARTAGETNQSIKVAIVEAIEAAIALNKRARAEDLVASIEAAPPGLRSPYLTAQALRFRARLAASDEVASGSYEAAAARFRELGVRLWLAVTLLEHGERMADAALLAEARELFEGLEATPWLERVATAAGTHRAHVLA
jgi:tetratricopeptide (TPR) repeat protein